MAGEMTEQQRVIAAALRYGWVVKVRGNVRVFSRGRMTVTAGFSTDGKVIEARVDGLNIRHRKHAAVIEALRKLG